MPALPVFPLQPEIRLKPGFSYHDDELHADGTAVSALARAAGTPLYVYSASVILERYRMVSEAFAELSPQIRYAVKANSNGALLRLLGEAGAGFDLVSGGELLQVLQVGADPSNLVFAGVGKQDWEIRLGLRAGVGLFSIESEDELACFTEIVRSEGRAARLALRLNPDVDPKTHEYIATGRVEHKFGIDFATGDRLIGKIHDESLLSLVALHVHLGSLIFEAEPYLAAARRVMEFLDEDPRRRHGITAYDMGGGFGIHGPFEPPLDLSQFAEGIRDLLVPRGLGLLLEPGRFLVGNAGLLVTKTIYSKRGAKKDFLIVDAAMNDLLRPALYGAQHEVLPVRLGRSDGARPVDVVGPVCESGDFLARDVKLPELGGGDLLAIFNSGAYGFCMASNYNSRPLAAEILTGDGVPRLVRRRQEHAELWRNDLDEPLDLDLEVEGPDIDPTQFG